MPTALTTLPVLVYDGDCAFCSSSIRWLQSRFPDAFAATPYQRADLERLGLTARACHERVQWIGDVTAPVTTRETGAQAVGALLDVGGRSTGGARGAAWRGAAALTRVRPTSWAADAIYALVAANRHRLPGGTPTCRL